MRKILFVLLTLTLNVRSNAQEAVALNQGQAAPFTGILITPKAAQDFKNTVIERDGLEDLQTSYERSIEMYKKTDELQQKKIDLLLTQNDKLAVRLGDSLSMNTWERIGWLSLGIVATGIAAYGLQQIKTSN